MEPTSTRPKALVTGDAGFIGSHLCEALLSDGWEVYALGRPLDRLARQRRAVGVRLIVD